MTNAAGPPDTTGKQESPIGYSWRKEAAADWGRAFEVIWDRISRPVARSAAVWYCGLCVMVLGGLGVWVSLIWLLAVGGDVPGLVIALGLSVLTYGLALASSGWIDTALAKDSDRHVRVILSLLSNTLLVIAIVCLGIWKVGCRQDKDGHLTFPWYWFSGSMVAWWAMWWIANASDERFCINADAQSAVGGTPLRALEG